uniref:Uncharacterized protein n=1 Tax=Haptolina brevifila TaxID=156173 RepID=A0A7S2BDK3_9EUKA
MDAFDESEFHMVESEDLILNLEHQTYDPSERAEDSPEPMSTGEDGEDLIAAFIDMGEEEEEAPSEDDMSFISPHDHPSGLDDVDADTALDEESGGDDDDDVVSESNDESAHQVSDDDDAQQVRDDDLHVVDKAIVRRGGKQFDLHVILLLVVGLIRLALEIGALHAVEPVRSRHPQPSVYLPPSFVTPSSNSAFLPPSSVLLSTPARPAAMFSPSKTALTRLWAAPCYGLPTAPRAAGKYAGKNAGKYVYAGRHAHQYYSKAVSKVYYHSTYLDTPPHIPVPRKTRNMSLWNMANTSVRMAASGSAAPLLPSPSLASLALQAPPRLRATQRTDSSPAAAAHHETHRDVKHDSHARARAISRAAARAATRGLLARLKRTTAEAHALKLEAARVTQIKQDRLARATALVLATESTTIDKYPRFSARTRRSAALRSASPTRTAALMRPPHIVTSRPVATPSRSPIHMLSAMRNGGVMVPSIPHMAHRRLIATTKVSTPRSATRHINLSRHKNRSSRVAPDQKVSGAHPQTAPVVTLKEVSTIKEGGEEDEFAAPSMPKVFAPLIVTNSLTIVHSLQVNNPPSKTPLDLIQDHNMKVLNELAKEAKHAFKVYVTDLVTEPPVELHPDESTALPYEGSRHLQGRRIVESCSPFLTVDCVPPRASDEEAERLDNDAHHWHGFHAAPPPMIAHTQRAVLVAPSPSPTLANTHLTTLSIAPPPVAPAPLNASHAWQIRAPPSAPPMPLPSMPPMIAPPIAASHLRAPPPRNATYMPSSKRHHDPLANLGNASEWLLSMPSTFGNAVSAVKGMLMMVAEAKKAVEVAKAAAVKNAAKNDQVAKHNALLFPPPLPLLAPPAVPSRSRYMLLKHTLPRWLLPNLLPSAVASIPLTSSALAPISSALTLIPTPIISSTALTAPALAAPPHVYPLALRHDETRVSHPPPQTFLSTFNLDPEPTTLLPTPTSTLSPSLAAALSHTSPLTRTSPATLAPPLIVPDRLTLQGATLSLTLPLLAPTPPTRSHAASPPPSVKPPTKAPMGLTSLVVNATRPRPASKSLLALPPINSTSLVIIDSLVPYSNTTSRATPSTVLKYLPAPDVRLALPSPCDCYVKTKVDAQRANVQRAQVKAYSLAQAQARARARAQAQVAVLEEALLERTNTVDSMHTEVHRLRAQLAKARQREVKMHTVVGAHEEIEATLKTQLGTLLSRQALMQSRINATEAQKSAVSSHLTEAKERARQAERRERQLTKELRKAAARVAHLKRQATRQQKRKKHDATRHDKHEGKLDAKQRKGKHAAEKRAKYSSSSSSYAYAA